MQSHREKRKAKKDGNVDFNFDTFSIFTLKNNDLVVRLGEGEKED